MTTAPAYVPAEKIRPGLPPLPERMRWRPLDHRGYPIPYFVAWIDGKPDFRVMDPIKWEMCVQFRRCWLCGVQLGRNVAFVIGPMCAVNKTSSEPPSHLECATYAAMACPFLTMPKMERRDDRLPEGWKPPAGEMLRRNPGVTLVWVTKTFKVWNAGNGKLIEIGPPQQTLWFAEGRTATRAEVLASIDSGLPALKAMADAEGPKASEALANQVFAAMALLPAEIAL